jgi:hypothetical protein
MSSEINSQVISPEDFDRWLLELSRIAQRADLPEEDDPLGRLTRQFAANNWAKCCDGLLKRTSRIRVTPEFSPAPMAFRFEIDCSYKRKRAGDGEIELVSAGTLRGEVIYRGDMFVSSDGPSVAVFIDRDLNFFHPNYCRRRGIVCLGDVRDFQSGPIPLDHLLENHIFPIVTYQNRRPSHALDPDAARYFALEPRAMEGLEVEPLY